MSSTLEDRLRRELTRTPHLDLAGSADAEDSNQLVLDEIRRRAEAERAEGPSGGRQLGGERRGAYRLAMAAATVATVGAAAALSTGGTPGSLRTDPAGSAADLVVQAPSPGWLIVIVMVGFAVASLARRLRAGTLLMVAVVVGTAGLAIGFASMVPSWQAGERLTTVVPDIEGFQPVDAELDRWPTLEGYDLVRITYRSTEPSATTAGLDALAEELDYNTGLPNLGLPCRQFANGQYDETDRSLSEYQRRTRSDFFCLADVDAQQLTVTGTEYSPGLLWFRTLIATPLLALAVVLGAIGLAEQRSNEPPRPIATQIGYGVALLLLGFALFFTGIFAVDAIRVSGVEGIRGCRSSPETVLNVEPDRFETCRQYVVDRVNSEDLHDPAARLYGPLIVIADVAAAVFTAVSGIVALTIARAGQLSTLRRRLLLVLVALSFLAGAVQLYHRDTIAVTTDAYD